MPVSFFGKNKTGNSSDQDSKSITGLSTTDGFHAAAAAMIDNINNSLLQPRMNQELATKLIELHARYFEQKLTQNPCMTSAEQLQKWMETPVNRANMLNELSYALRQIAVDEMCANPIKYRKDFVTHGLTPAVMRLPTTTLHKSAMAALETALKLPIKIKTVKPGKEIPLQEDGDRADIKNPIGSPIVLQRQGSYYLPKLNDVHYFSSISAIITAPLEPKTVPVHDPDLAEIVTRIEQDNSKLIDELEHTAKYLKSMVDAGELSKEALINIYIKGIKHPDDQDGPTKYLGTGYGTQHFFETLLATRSDVEPIVLAEESHDRQVVRELVEALARSISVGQLDSALVYEAEDKSSLNYTGA